MQIVIILVNSLVYTNDKKILKCSNQSPTRNNKIFSTESILQDAIYKFQYPLHYYI